VVLGLLCRMHQLTLTVHCHRWFNRAYYRASSSILEEHGAAVRRAERNRTR
jgi:hypothetical protein